MIEAKSKGLLLGGPYDWHTISVGPDQHEVLFALPTRKPMEPRYSDEVVNSDLQVARYWRAEALWGGEEIVGYIFRFGEIR